ncbi:hypothetical protein L1987_35347 [Smallanthus sonchifolius]|uniref:Uncharacterized protein n=1 Tax=Smallanthus sonchifolius TaxID=185202 RepID=A0ACB9HWD1_9ASTR|nr:hypothetical protein L1987_35347 [Smallanthus sonchifolius]
MQQEDGQIGPEISITLEETIEEFQQCVEDILDEIEQDENFSEMTAENYDNKKSYLTRHLIELSRLHRLLADQHVCLVEEVSKNCPSLIKYQYLDSSDSSSPQVIQMLTHQKSSPLKLKMPVGSDFVFRAIGGGSNISKSEGLESSSSLSSDSGSESTNKLPSSPVKDGVLRVKETKAQEHESEITTEKSNVVDEPVSDKKLLEDETTKLKSQENESEITSEKSNMVDEPVSDKKLLEDETTELKSQENESEITSEKSNVVDEPVSDKKLLEDETTELKSEENESEITTEKSNVVDEPVSDKKLLEDETTKLKSQENESEITTENSHLELQKQVDDLKLVISESDLKIKAMEEELEKSRKSLSIAKDTISNLKGEKSSKVYQQNLMMKYELQSGQKLVGQAREQLAVQMENFHRLEQKVESCASEITVREDQIKKLNTKNDRYKSEILRLEETLKSKEDIWNHDVIKLKVQLKNKSKSFDDLKRQLNTVRSERNRTCGKLETLEEERCSQDKLIQELETRLNTLQVEHERVVSSFENAEKLNNELTSKVVELEREVARQREVISVITEEKIEAIKQLSFSLEHYMSNYKQLRQLYAANKTCFFGFSNCLNTQ